MFSVALRATKWLYRYWFVGICVGLNCIRLKCWKLFFSKVQSNLRSLSNWRRHTYFSWIHILSYRLSNIMPIYIIYIFLIIGLSFQNFKSHHSKMFNFLNLSISNANVMWFTLNPVKVYNVYATGWYKQKLTTTFATKNYGFLVFTFKINLDKN